MLHGYRSEHRIRVFYLLTFNFKSYLFLLQQINTASPLEILNIILTKQSGNIGKDF